MTPEELYDLFVSPHASIEEIAAQNLDTATRQIAELRNDAGRSDGIAYTDQEIAEAILAYAKRTQ